MSSYALKEEKEKKLFYLFLFFFFPTLFFSIFILFPLVLMERDGLAWLAASLDLHIKHIEENRDEETHDSNTLVYVLN